VLLMLGSADASNSPVPPLSVSASKSDALASVSLVVFVLNLWLF